MGWASSPPLGCGWQDLLRSRHDPGWSMGASLRPCLWHLRLLGFGWIVSFEKALCQSWGQVGFEHCVPSRASTDSHSQAPDGNFASSGKMLLIVACISHANGTWAKEMMLYYSVWKRIDGTEILFGKLCTQYRNCLWPRSKQCAVMKGNSWMRTKYSSSLLKNQGLFLCWIIRLLPIISSS